MITIDTTFTDTNTTVYFGDSVNIIGGATNLAGSAVTVTGNLTTGGNTFAHGSLSGSTINVGGNLNWGGTHADPYDFTNTSWLLNVTGSAVATYCNVSNSNASGGSLIVANDGTSVDSGNNLHWLFFITGLGSLCGDIELSPIFGGSVAINSIFGGSVVTQSIFDGTLIIGRLCQTNS